ncbi:MAG: hypothetical protein Q9165_001983 [Trypethelium subeluteriae]
MFSYLRTHKRSGSNPSSPNPTSITYFPPPPLQSPSSRHEEYPFLSPPPGPVEAEKVQSPSPISPFPPVLPPIPRVASQDKGSIYSRRGTAKTQVQADSVGARISSGLANIRRRPSQSSPPPYSPNTPIERPSSGGEESQKQARPNPNTKTRAGSFRVQDRDKSPGHGASRSADVTYYRDSPSASPVYGGPALMPASSDSSDSGRPPLKAPHGGPPQAPKTTKKKLALGNPMSLLMRRRSTQALERLSDDSLASVSKGPPVPPMTMPENYDPRIRGKFIHDFSAPRPKRNFSYNDLEAQEEEQFVSPPWIESVPRSGDGNATRRPQSADHYSPIHHERAHTPVFREHFEEETGSRPRGSAIRAEELANADFLARNADLVSSEELSVSTRPQTRRPLPLPPPQPPQKQISIEEIAEPHFVSSSQLPTVVESSPVGTPVMQDVAASRSPPKSRARAPSASESTVQPTRQPKHHTSNASRFSFQMMDKDSIAQEKLLEEKHRQQAARKQQEQASIPLDPYADGVDDMEDYDEADDAGLYEEPIPGVNADSDYEDFEGTPPPSSLGALGISLSNMAIGAPVSPPSPHLDAGRSPNQDLIPGHGKASLQSPTTPTLRDTEHKTRLRAYQSSSPVPDDEPFLDSGHYDSGRYDIESQNYIEPPAAFGFGDEAADEMYFDDGLIDEPDVNDDQKFDESVFDDPSHPLYERKKMSTEPIHQAEIIVPDIRESFPLDTPEEESVGKADALIDEKTQTSDRGNLNVPHNSVKEYRASDGYNRRASGPTPSRNDLAAYHSALAEAAQKAAADGKFAWHDRLGSDNSDGLSERDDSFGHSSRPSLIPDDGRYSQESNFFTPSGLLIEPSKSFDEADYEADDFEGGLEDDPIIAAANAEALASDDDGFYGQEFGFYANACGSDAAEFANGGYFGPRGVDALGRSTSGRNAVREPNLTPITERSEFSTRNSFISVQGHWGPPSASSAAIPSPGVAQLARLSPYALDEDEMSLSQLMKLRRGAFGGSNGSLRSGSNSPSHPSPVAYPLGAARGTNSSPTAPSVSVPGPLGPAYANNNNPDGLSPVTTSRHGSQSLHGDSPLAYPASDFDLDPDSSPSPSPLSRNSPTITASSGFAIPPPPSSLPSQPISEESEEELAEAGAAQPPPPLLLPSSSPSPRLPWSTNNSSSSSVPSPLAHTTSADDSASLSLPLLPPSSNSALQMSSPLSATSPLPSSSSSAVARGGVGRKQPHSRSASGTADRLTYVHELGEPGSGDPDRWVLERRRTAETGELELVGREIVRGGTI